MEYWRLVRKSPYMLAFGFSHAFFAWPGQTFLISLFVPQLREATHLTSSEFGFLYSAATLLGALMLPMLGRKIDNSDIRIYSFWTAIGLSVACFGVFASTHVFTLFLSLFLLRLTSQGLMGHIATTAMVRHFAEHRGKALGIANLGYPICEAMLPALLAPMILTIGWRESWVLYGIFSLCVFLPISQFLIRHPKAYDNLALEECDGACGSANVGWHPKQVLRDPRFYTLIPLTIMPSLFLSGTFFFHSDISQLKGWDPLYLNTSIALYGLARIFSSLATGPIMDRLGALRMMPVHVLPMALGFLLLAFTDYKIGGMMYLILSGLSIGTGNTVKSAVWAELYGTKHIGAIRSWVATYTLIAAAISPALTGFLLDHHFQVRDLLLIASSSTLISSLVAHFACRKEVARRLLLQTQATPPFASPLNFTERANSQTNFGTNIDSGSENISEASQSRKIQTPSA